MPTTYDTNGTVSITNGETIVVTHNGNSGSETPVVTLLDASRGGAFTVDATNHAEAVLDSISAGTDVTLDAAGGTIDVNAFSADDTVAATIAGGGSLIVGSGINTDDKVSVDFASAGQLQLQQGLDLLDTVAINGFAVGDSVLVDGLMKDACGWSTFTVTTAAGPDGTSDDTISFFNVSHDKIIALTLDGVPRGQTVTAVADGCATLIEAVCFLSGTHIATADGECPVESLREGDLVRTHRGDIMPVKWVGHRSIDTRTLRQPELAMPVRITAGAIADGVPQRDLRVTPEHAVLVGGHLIPARLLVNGSTIRLEQLDSYTFHHVELERHDILLAEGLGAESYLDTGNRGLFANHDVVELFAAAPEATVADYNARSCMPLTVDPTTTGTVWQTLATRAALLGPLASQPRTTVEGELAVQAAGRRLQPVYAEGRRVGFALPPGTTTITIASRASMPWSLQPWLDDRRRLGVAIDRIVLRSGDEVHTVALDGPALGAGWWATEMAAGRCFRWTNGAAQLALPSVQGPATLEIGLHAVATHALAAEHTNPLPVARAG